jgi:hypothetical protein
MDPQLPHIEFQYLVCSILPATPLSLVLFYQLGIIGALKDITFEVLLLLAFSNLIFGLFIDIMRHHIEASFESGHSHREMNFHLYEFSANFAIAAILGLFSLVIGYILYKCDNEFGSCWYNSFWGIVSALIITVIISVILSWCPIRGYLFCINAPREKEILDNGDVSEDLKTMFRSKGFPLSENVTCSKVNGDKWKITNGKKIYTIKKKKEELKIYGERKTLYRIAIPKDCIEEKYLFSIDAKFENDLNNGNISPELEDIFKTKGFPISISETATVTKDDKWVITYGEKIYVVKKEDGNLNIYK